MEENIYITKIKKINGTSYKEVCSKAKVMYKDIQSRSKRRPYLRSNFFKNEKVFIDFFWDHIFQKNKSDRFRRLKQYPCGLDLIKRSSYLPLIKMNPNNSSEKLYRFVGRNGNGEIFYVQIKENIKNGQKDLASIFPDV